MTPRKGFTNGDIYGAFNLFLSHGFLGRMTKRLSSILTDEQWAVLRPLIREGPTAA